MTIIDPSIAASIVRTITTGIIIIIIIVIITAVGITFTTTTPGGTITMGAGIIIPIMGITTIDK